jgi:redox-sensitive bicupin YhaK (pirin superfamily)
MAEPTGTTGTQTQAGQAPLAVRRDSEIYGTDGGWFRARWHFSFDQYHDPDNMGVGQLRVFNHDTLVSGAVWPMHPHRDVEGITLVVAGEFEHADSLGNDGVLLPGGVQRMTLGSGAYHSERNHSQTQEMQFIQMWIMPAEHGLAPSVEQHQYTEADRTNRLLRFLKPAATEGEGITVHQDASMFVSRLETGVSVSHEFAEGHVGYFYLISGAVRVNGEVLETGDAAKVLGAGSLTIEAGEVSELLLVDVIS